MLSSSIFDIWTCNKNINSIRTKLSSIPLSDMSQKGGTWDPSAGSELGSPAHDKSDGKAKVQESSHNQNQVDVATVNAGLPTESHEQVTRVSNTPGWTVVNKPSENDESKTHHGDGPGMDTSFSLQIGWGRWKTTVMSWKMSIRKERD
ncbi:hypothetical protein B0J11DRAFT_297918 [Dendryphion nanum]|uniref:Uncharacterized protein n=1 Tax=Dendryphion nanum TaxID=256645 RepID=A0A9P9DVY2_9PLEO|nr:hypothetical protein B0J11DRAFT_297918 [Dendryphion nanum]